MIDDLQLGTSDKLFFVVEEDGVAERLDVFVATVAEITRNHICATL